MEDTLTADADKQGAKGAGAGIRPPRGSHRLWARPEGRGRRRQSPVERPRGATAGQDPHLLPLRDRHRGRQEKVCLTRASSGSGRWASRGDRGTRRCKVPSEAEELGAGEEAALAEPCRQRAHIGSSARTSSSSRKGLSPKRSSSCRRSFRELPQPNSSSCCLKPGLGLAMGRVALMASSTSRQLSPVTVITYAVTMVVLREMPAKQCTRQFPPLRRQQWMKLIHSLKCFLLQQRLG